MYILRIKRIAKHLKINIIFKLFLKKPRYNEILLKVALNTINQPSKPVFTIDICNIMTKLSLKNTKLSPFNQNSFNATKENNDAINI